MAVKTLPLDYDIVLYSGTSYRRVFRWLPDGVTPVDLTAGWSAEMRIGQPGQAALVQLSAGSGITLTAAGEIVVVLTPEQTSSLPPGVSYYNLDVTAPDGFVRRFLRGRASVIVDVGHWSP